MATSGRKLTDYEKIVIRPLHEAGMSLSQICLEAKCGKNTVIRVLKSPQDEISAKAAEMAKRHLPAKLGRLALRAGDRIEARLEDTDRPMADRDLVVLMGVAVDKICALDAMGKAGSETNILVLLQNKLDPGFLGKSGATVPPISDEKRRTEIPEDISPEPVRD